MRKEKLKDIIEIKSKPGQWPYFYVVTDKNIYEFTGQTFVKSDVLPLGQSIPIIKEYVGQMIVEVKGDGESTIISLENGDKVSFELTHDPFGSEIESWPIVRLYTKKEAEQWINEYKEMDTLF